MSKKVLYLNSVWIIFLLTFFSSCKLKDGLFTDPSQIQNDTTIVIAKWLNDYDAAISINVDDGAPYTELNTYVQKLVHDMNLTLDYELVTDAVLNDSIRKTYILNNLLPRNFGVFGHGHKHENHDKYTYDEALESFKQCFNGMRSLGIKPVAYAYPGGFGYLFRTRRALKESGFLCGRRFEQLDAKDPFIMPDSICEPKDWFGLPTLVMQSFDYDGCEAAINNTGELIPFLKESIQKTAWIILTYHGIGNHNEYGFYEMSDFENDLKTIKSYNFWCASINDITLYCYERNHAKVKAWFNKNKNEIIENLTIQLSDGYPNDYFNQSLTLKFKIPESWVNRKLLLVKKGNAIETYLFNTQEAKLSIPPDESTYILKLQ